MNDSGEPTFLLSDLIGLPATVDEAGWGRIADLAVTIIGGKLEVEGLIVSSDGNARSLVVCKNFRISRPAMMVSAEAGDQPEHGAQPQRFHLAQLVFGRRLLDREEATIRTARDAHLALRGGELIVSKIDFDAPSPQSSDVLAFVHAQVRQFLYPAESRTSVAIQNVVIPALHAADGQSDRLLPTDLADILPEMAMAERIAELGRLDAYDAVSVLLREAPSSRRALMENFSTARMARLISASTPARAVGLLSVLALAEIECILAATERPQAERVRHLIWNKAEALIHFLSPCRLELPLCATVNDAIQTCRQLDHQGPGLTDCFIVDVEHRLVGAVSIANLILNHPATRLSAIMTVRPARLQQDELVLKASRLFRRYPVATLPVVDPRDRLVGEIGREEVAFILGEFSELRSQY